MVELSLFALLAQSIFCICVGFYLSQFKSFSSSTTTPPNDDNAGDTDNLNDNNAVNDRYGLLDGKPHLPTPNRVTMQ